MKVKELQKNLSALDPESEVLCYSEDEMFQGEDRIFAVFTISSVGQSEATRCRLDDEAPYLKFGKGDASQKLTILEITSDD